MVSRFTCDVFTLKFKPSSAMFQQFTLWCKPCLQSSTVKDDNQTAVQHCCLGCLVSSKKQSTSAPSACKTVIIVLISCTSTRQTSTQYICHTATMSTVARKQLGEKMLDTVNLFGCSRSAIVMFPPSVRTLQTHFITLSPKIPHHYWVNYPRTGHRIQWKKGLCHSVVPQPKTTSTQK